MTELKEKTGGMVLRAEVCTSIHDLRASVLDHHAKARSAGIAMFEHMIAAGEALLRIKEQTPYGAWVEWLKTNLEDVSFGHAQFYMRCAHHQALLREHRPADCRSANRLFASVAPSNTVPQELKDEARRMHKAGATYKEIAERLDLNYKSIPDWVNPKRRERRRQHRRDLSLAARRAERRKQRDAAVKRKGGEIAIAYGHIRKALEALQRADRELVGGEMHDLVSRAMAGLYRAEDSVVAVSKEAAPS